MLVNWFIFVNKSEPMAGTIRKVKSADRTLDLLEALAAAPKPLSPAELSAALGIPRSSLFHLAGTLIDRGYLTVDAENRYRLGARLAEVFGRTRPEVHLGNLVDPVLQELSLAINETSGFSIQHGDDVEVVATHISQHALTYTMRKADLAPLYAVSAGKVILAHKSADWLDAYLQRVRFERFTPNTIQSHERLLREIERARLEGFGTVDQEFTPGIIGLAAPVSVDGRVIGAVNVAMPSVRADPTATSNIRQKLMIAVHRAETILARVL
jgi:DNA-binding IclR family transcriptional regulator